MNTTPFHGLYVRSAVTALVLALALAVAFSDLRVSAWVALQPFFQWLETSWFGLAGKTWGAVFAVVQAFHLVSMAIIGGCVLLADGRLLGLWLTDMDARQILDRSHRLFLWALAVVVVTGVFMACSVAMKIYYLPVYWYKMLALGAGIAFVFGIRRPLLAGSLDTINPIVLKSVAVASLMIWFTVAATGRWIGFSG